MITPHEYIDSVKTEAVCRATEAVDRRMFAWVNAGYADFGERIVVVLEDDLTPAENYMVRKLVTDSGWVNVNIVGRDLSFYFPNTSGISCIR